ncbi:MAG: ribbon-helix-helix domain-containing protein [Leptospirales bacterium]
MSSIFVARTNRLNNDESTLNYTIDIYLLDHLGNLYYNVGMRQVISISLDEETKERLDNISQSRHLNKSFIVKEALRKYLFLEEMELTRTELRPYAEKQGYVTDEDIFKNIS